jgi:hypothetical protein
MIGTKEAYRIVPAPGASENPRRSMGVVEDSPYLATDKIAETNSYAGFWEIGTEASLCRRENLPVRSSSSE